ncbi:MAG: hypothetical protein A2342_02735 [Gallionellales bacterium RIFOXYB12_FULL_54_9]|nr:MAG: hypothetical protein A2342_02735 [Gallionellales bacterium RIFOXYB12_FULL_54_9]
MIEKTNYPAISRQVTTLVLAGSTDQAEEAFSELAEEHGDLAIVEVLDAMEPQVASMHLAAFDGGKLSLATLLISPQAWSESLAFFAAIWDEEMIEDEPEFLAEALFAHIHGVLFASDDLDRRGALIYHALSTDWGTTAFAVLFSTAITEIIELANEIHSRGVHNSGQTSSDHDIIPLALAIARTDSDAWDRVLLELFPDWQPGENELHARPEEEEDEEYGYEYATPRSTRELLIRLRKQVPGKVASVPKTGARPSMGEDIFA